jgi:uncharacterized protein YbaP (TraB family)
MISKLKASKLSASKLIVSKLKAGSSMKKHFIYISCLLLCLCLQSTVSAAQDKAFFWQVSSGNVSVYLLGSIHAADKSFYPLRQDIEDAYAHSTFLVVELDINQVDSGAYNRILLEKGVYRDGVTIKEAISDETWLQLRQQLRQLNISYDAVKTYKPGILVLTLSAAQVMHLGFDPQLGIDMHFLLKAAQTEKQIVELETLEQQIDLFLDVPDGELLLKESLHSLRGSELLMADMVRFWKQGDEAKMNALLFEQALIEYPVFAEIYDRLFYERNQQMTFKIEQMLKKSDATNKAVTKVSYFVVVGSGHLIGDKGIVSELRQKGYEVKRL